MSYIWLVVTNQRTPHQTYEQTIVGVYSGQKEAVAVAEQTPRDDGQTEEDA
jgi:hypothetical protein